MEMSTQDMLSRAAANVVEYQRLKSLLEETTLKL